MTASAASGQDPSATTMVPTPTSAADPTAADPTAADPGAADAGAALAATALGPPETRGRTQIADRVLERIAVRATAEIDQAGGAARRLLGIPLGRDTAHAAPRVTAHVDGHLATLEMRISIVYPAPIRQVTRRLRDHVTTRVAELTGLELRQVDIDIARLTPPQQQARRVQ